MSKQAMPSWIGGVMKPSDIADPKAPKVWYEKPAGSASSLPEADNAALVGRTVRRLLRSIVAPAAGFWAMTPALATAVPSRPSRRKCLRST